MINIILFSLGFSALFYLILFVTSRIFKAPIQRDWSRLLICAFPLLAFISLYIISSGRFSPSVRPWSAPMRIAISQGTSPKSASLITSERVKVIAGIGDSQQAREEMIYRLSKRPGKSLLIEVGKEDMDLSVLKGYLKGWPIQHVIFLEGGRLLGFADAKKLLDYLEANPLGPVFLRKHIPQLGLKRDAVYSNMGWTEAFSVMTSRGLDALAVIDKDTAVYKGMALRQQIIGGLVSGLIERLRSNPLHRLDEKQQKMMEILKEIQAEIGKGAAGTPTIPGEASKTVIIGRKIASRLDYMEAKRWASQETVWSEQWLTEMAGKIPILPEKMEELHRNLLKGLSLFMAKGDGFSLRDFGLFNIVEVWIAEREGKDAEKTPVYRAFLTISFEPAPLLLYIVRGAAIPGRAFSYANGAFIEELSKRTGLEAIDVDKALGSLLRFISSWLAQGRNVILPEVGAFFVEKRSGSAEPTVEFVPSRSNPIFSRIPGG